MDGDFRIGLWLVEPSLNTVSCNGSRRHLEPKVMAVLVCLAKAQNGVVSKQQLIAEVWKDTFVTDDVLTRSISELRDAFADDARNPKVIQTIAKRGYRLLLPLSGAEHSAAARHRLRLLLPVTVMACLLAIAGLLAFRQFRRGREAIGSSPLTITRLTHSGKVEADGAAVSPDGKYFYYVRMENGRDSIRMRQVGGINEITIFQGKSGSIYGLVVGPKGDKLYFAQDNEIFVMPLPGGIPRKIVSDTVSPASVSPDGSRIAFLRRSFKDGTWDVVVADSDGSNEQVVRRRPMPLFYSDESLMSWSPDGRSLAVAARSTSSGELAIIDLTSGSERVIPPQGWQGGTGNTAWLPDGSGIVFQAWNAGTSQLWLVKLPEGMARQLTRDSASYTNASVTADGQMILSTQTEMSRSLWVADYNDPAKAHEVGDSPKALQGIHGITWTSNGKIVYGSEETGRDLWVLDPQSGSKQRLTEDPALDALPRASRDSRYIFYTKWKPEGWNIWRMDADGRNSRALTNTGHAGFPQVSHDGRTVLFISNETRSRLWRISADGDKAAMVTDMDARRPAYFSPDDRLIAFFSKEREPGNTIIIAARSGTRVQTAEGRNQSFTPDQKALLSVESFQGVNNIIVRPLDGRAAYPLTRFREKGVEDFAISLDGKKLALVRANDEADVVAITGFRNPATQ